MSLLFEFKQYSTPGLAQSGGLLNVWRFTDAQEPIDFLDETWNVATAIKPTDFELSSERNSGSLSLRVSRDFPVAKIYLYGYPARPVWLRILDSETGFTAYKGKLKSVEWSESEAKINIAALSELFKREGLRIKFQGPCGWDLYGPRCGISRAAYSVPGILYSLPLDDGLTVVSGVFGAKPNGYFTAGDFECNGQMRTIVSHIGNQITLLAPIDGLQGGEAFTASQGCDRSAGATGCARFNNIPAFGGCVNVPRKNPFNGLD